MAVAGGALIRPLATHAEFAACEALSRGVWGAGGRNVVPRELLHAMQRNGGVVLGAFTGSGGLCGFVVGFLGMHEGGLRLWSHQLAVSPDFRGQGLGQRLKWAQREASLALGVDRIAWTFDPLEARNAYLNLHRLGALARHYSRDHYGAMDDALNAGLASDRFVAEWWLRSAGVARRLAGRWPGGTIAEVQRRGGVVLLRAVGGSDGVPEPVPVDQVQPGVPAVVGIPADFQQLKQLDLRLAAAWRAATRAALEAALAAGLAATDFLVEGAYLLEPRPTAETEGGCA